MIMETSVPLSNVICLCIINNPWCEQLYFNFNLSTCTLHLHVENILFTCLKFVMLFFQIFEFVHQCVLSEIGIPGHERC